MKIEQRFTQTIGATLLAFVITTAPANAAETDFVSATLYVRKDLVTNKTDSKLINPWGVSFFPGGPFWVSDNGTGLSTTYNGDGSPGPVTITIPSPGTGPSKPTGQVAANLPNAFLVPGSGSPPTPARFIFATEDGTIAAWSSGPQAVLVANLSTSGAIYKGLAMGSNPNGVFLYATNFHAGTVDVFDTAFRQISLPNEAFKDRHIPAGYAPFGIENVHGDLFVTYAKQDADKEDDVAGPGHGFVDVFDTSGRLIRRFASRGRLNSPWGIAAAPLGFGKAGGMILIGNFGDGRINVFGPQGDRGNEGDHGRSDDLGAQLGSTRFAPFRIDGLWALKFGGAAKSSPDTLYFTAGPNDETEGLFGSITPVVGAVEISDR